MLAGILLSKSTEHSITFEEVRLNAPDKSARWIVNIDVGVTSDQFLYYHINPYAAGG